MENPLAARADHTRYIIGAAAHALPVLAPGDKGGTHTPITGGG